MSAKLSQLEDYARKMEAKASVQYAPVRGGTLSSSNTNHPPSAFSGQWCNNEQRRQHKAMT